MRIVLNDVVLEIPGDGNDCPEYTKTFIGILLKMIEKGKDNPAFQLHAMSLLTTGKSFLELISKGDTDVEHLIEAVKILAEGAIDITSSGGAEMSGMSIEDFLGGDSDG